MNNIIWLLEKEYENKGEKDIKNCISKLRKDNNINCNFWKNKFTPLIFAILLNYNELVELIIDNWADINITDKDWWTPLNVASFYWVIDSLLVLLNKKWDQFIKEDLDSSILLAIKKSNIDIVIKLLEFWWNIDFSYIDDYWKNLLMQVLDVYFLHTEKKKKLFLYLIDKVHNININHKDEMWNNLLIYAIKTETDIAKKILQLTPNLNDINNAWETALMIACENPDIKIIKILLCNKLDINKVNNKWETALHYISKNINITISTLVIKELLNNKSVDINIPDENWNTPMMNLLWNNNIEWLKLLFKKWADASIKDNKWKTVIQQAYDFQSIDAINLFK
jgi:ankyrin repeat protein